MEFMNTFLDEESSNMAQFLATVSGAPPEDWLHGVGEGGERGELGRHLATLHTVLVDSVCKVPAADGQGLEGLKTVLNDISNNLHHPTSTTLESIAEPTPFKIKRMSVEEKSPPTSSSGGLSNWIGLSWTLGRGEVGGGGWEVGGRQHWLSSKELHISHASAIPEQETSVNIKPF